jgi:spore coat protein U-like protein
MRNFASRAALAAAALVLGLSGANAATATGTIGVSATVTSTCVVNPSTPVAFGGIASNYTGDVDANGIVSVTCANTLPYSVGLDNGGNFLVSRRMISGINFLNYQLFSDNARTQVWGTTIGTDTVPGIGSGVAQTYTVYGRVPVGQTIIPGSYADTVNVTVTF